MAVAKPPAQTPKTELSGDGGTSSTEADAAPQDSEEQHQDASPTGRWLHADKPLGPGDADALHFGPYADALALLMDWKDTRTPLTIAINGPWGSGKTSLAKMTQARLPIGSDWNAEHIICWFDAWANDDAEHLGAAFAATVAKAANKQRRPWTRLFMPLPSVMLTPEQRWWRRLRLGLLAVALAAAAIFWPTGGALLAPWHPGAAVSTLGPGKTAARLVWPLLIVAVIALAQRLAPSIQGVARWIDNPGSEAARGSMEDANRQLRRLINQALRGKRRLMIFVDNLERCRPPRAVEVCEVVSQLIGHPDVVTVLIGDMDTIALSAGIKYKALESVSPTERGTPPADGTPGPASRRAAVGEYGRAYLEKLIQIQLSLPPPLRKDLRGMLVPGSGARPAFPLLDGESEDDLPADKVRLDTSSFAGLVAGFLIGGTISFVVYFLFLQPPPLRLGEIVVTPTTTEIFGRSLPFVTAGVVLGGLLGTVWQVFAERSRQRQRERTRKALDEAVSSEVETTETTVRPDAVEKLANQVTKTEEKGIRRRMRQRIISRNKLREDLDEAVYDVLPSSPRAAKRMFNHAHLLLDIGVERGIFAEQFGLKASQLAAWVALTERWPSVAAAVTSDPTLMGRLEGAIQQAAPNFGPEQITMIENQIGITGLDSTLVEYLHRTDSLVPVVRMLVNFSPDTDKASA